MGFSYRKSKKVGPFRFTASKSGISTSVGVKGYRVTRKANGRVQTTASIPGTGIRYTKQIGKSDTSRDTIIYSKNSYKAAYIIANITGSIVAILSLLLLIVILPIGIISSVITVLIFLLSNKWKKIYLSYDELNNEN